MEPKNLERNDNHVKSDLLRFLLIGTGMFSIAAGVVGIFLPVVPTVPFLLLAALCFSKSSERFHSWLIEHRQLGPLIRDFLSSGSIPLKAKLAALVTVWISFPVSAFLLVEIFWLKLLLMAAAGAVTLYLLYLPTAAPAGKGNGEPG